MSKAERPSPQEQLPIILKAYLDATPKFKKFKGKSISAGYSLPISNTEKNIIFLNCGISFTYSTKITNDWGHNGYDDISDDSIGVYNLGYIPYVNVELKKFI